MRVQVVERERDFSGVELCDRIGKALRRSVSHGSAIVGEARENKEGTSNTKKERTCDFRSKLNSSPPSTKSMTM